MAFDTLMLKNPQTGEIKKAPVGFSWTTWFWGCIPAFIRTDWKWGAIMFVAQLFTWGLANLVFAFIYNKIYIKDLVYDKGFKVTGSEKGNLQLISNKLEMELPML
jgi:hypothetical protein